LYEKNGYKSAATVIRMLADIVSKNGNLLLNIPVRGDGTIDDKEQGVLEGIAAWMDVNRECIFGTRPWKLFGEGPASEGAALSAQGFNEGKGRPFTADDFRFTTKGNVLYAIELGWPTNAASIKSLGTAAKLLDKSIGGITLLGSAEKVQWSQNADALTIKPPQNTPSDAALLFAADPPRQQLNFNREWKYQLGDHPGAAAVGYDDSKWDDIGLPHSFSIPYFASPKFYTGY